MVVFCLWGGGKRRSASNMKCSFQKGSLVLLVGSTCGWFGSSGVDAKSIHLLMLLYAANNSSLVVACMCRYIVERNGGGSMLR